MLYLASSSETGAAELGAPGIECFVGALRLFQEFKVLDLLNIEEGEDGWELLQALARSALLSAPYSGEGWVRREYIFALFRRRLCSIGRIRRDSLRINQSAGRGRLGDP
jgi:hypothetical protein